MTNMLLHGLMSFIGTMGFSIIFNVPRRELLVCGLAGAAAWLVYQVTLQISPDAVVVATLLGAMTVTYISRIASYIRHMPVTIYMIPGVIPLVPGAGIYYTMFNAVMGYNDQALLLGFETLRTAGVIAVGLLIVLSLPRKMFTFYRGA